MHKHHVNSVILTGTFIGPIESIDNDTLVAHIETQDHDPISCIVSPTNIDPHMQKGTQCYVVGELRGCPDLDTNTPGVCCFYAHHLSPIATANYEEPNGPARAG